MQLVWKLWPLLRILLNNVDVVGFAVADIAMAAVFVGAALVDVVDAAAPIGAAVAAAAPVVAAAAPVVAAVASCFRYYWKKREILTCSEYFAMGFAGSRNHICCCYCCH